MTITPEQADTLAANYVEPWEMPDCPDAVELWESAYDLAQTIATMRWEYGVEQATGVTQWFRSRTMAEAHAEVRGAFRLVRRLVGLTEAIDSE